MVLLKRVGVRPVAVYTIGIRLWVTTPEAGIHAPIAGVIAGLLAPTKPFVPIELVDEAVLADVSTVQATDETVRLARSSSRWLNGLRTASTRGPSFCDRPALRVRERRYLH